MKRRAGWTMRKFSITRCDLADYRRNSDPRYYKGVEYADTVEALARRRAAQTFAANGIPPTRFTSTCRRSPADLPTTRSIKR
jgi:hypothetical protein